MRRALWFGLATVAALCVASGPASAAQVMLKVDVPFQFVVEGRTMPAGAYEILEPGQDVLELRGSSGTSAALAIVTRLAARSGSTVPDEVVFDKVGGQNILSEVWYMGEDGYLVAATKAPHAHTLVKASREK